MQTRLPSWHYASQWPADVPPRPLDEMTELGTRYVQSTGADRKALGLELLEAFHPYLAKYLDIIVRGHLPWYGRGEVNEDSKQLLMLLMPAGEQINKYTLLRTCKHLHLAFKGSESAEIYNVLATLLLGIVAKYDPFYTDKMRRACSVVDRWLTPRFSAKQISDQLDFDAASVLNKLVNRPLTYC
jgi:hypothetical protein